MRIPDWLLEHFKKENYSCPHCRAAFNVSGVKVIGIKAIDRAAPENNKDKLYVYYICTECNKSAGFEITEMTLEGFATAILDSVEEIPRPAEEEKKERENIFSPKKPSPSSSKEQSKAKPQPQKQVSVSKSKSKITPDEKKQAVNMLDNCRYWTDWLRMLGAEYEEDQGQQEPRPSNFKLDSEDQL